MICYRPVVALALATSLLPYLCAAPGATAREALTEIRIDWATYNPVSVALKESRLLEAEFEKDGVAIRWVQSMGSNKALEFLSAGAIDFGSTAGASSLIGWVQGNPIRAVYAYSHPEWTALVTRTGSAIKTVADLKGKAIAVTRGTDPHVFLVRCLQQAGLSERDVKVILLQHADGKAALLRGDVDAWAGLDPLMAAAELEGSVKLFHRDKNSNSWGILNVRQAFADGHPDVVKRVLKIYDIAKAWSIAHPEELQRLLAKSAKLPLAVVERQMNDRTELAFPAIGDAQKTTIYEAGLALQKAGVIRNDVDVKSAVDHLVDTQYSSRAR